MDGRSENDSKMHLREAASRSSVNNHGPERRRKVIITQHSHGIHVCITTGVLKVLVLLHSDHVLTD